MTKRRRKWVSHKKLPTTQRVEASSRRDALRLLLGSSLLPLVGCESGSEGEGFGGFGDATVPSEGGVGSYDADVAWDDGSVRGDAGAVPNADDAGARDAGGDTDAGSETDAGGETDAGLTTEGWASGGTASMTDKDAYPDPFTTAAASCVLVASTTQGPCTTANDLAREDVSEGWTGLPVRLALQVVDSSCNPLPGATVRIWHTNMEGSYSGQTPNNGMCLQDQAYASQDFFRGVQTTDAAGRVYFDTCFPGWYRGRAIHIHFQVESGNTSYRISQLGFPEEVISDVFASHPDYQNYGQPDTSFASDNIFRSVSNPDAHILEVSRMTDGAMLASKVVTVL